MRATETAEIEGLRALFAAATAEVAAAQGIGVLDLGRSQNGILQGRSHGRRSVAAH